MADVIKSAGWDIELIRCAHLEPKGGDYAVFAVNFVIPHAAIEDPNDSSLYWVDGVRSAVCTGEEAVTALGDLLRPWKWLKVKWTLHASTDGQAPWDPVPLLDETSGVWPVEADDRNKVQDALTIELESRTKGCEDAFSIDDSRWHGTSEPRNSGWALVNQSWPHALAALTHTPAGLSNDVLSAARFLRVRRADLPSTQWLVAFPEFDLGQKTFKIQSVEARKQRLAAIYDKEWSGAKLVMGSDRVQETVDLVDLGAPLIEGRRGRGIIDRVFASHLLPLESLAFSVEKLEYTDSASIVDRKIIEMPVFPRNAWLLALLAPLGTGWLRLRARRYPGGPERFSRPHVLNFLFSGANAGKLLEAYGATAANLSQQLEAAFVPVNIAQAAERVESLLVAFEKRSDIDPKTMEDTLTTLLTAPIPDLPEVFSQEDIVARRAAVQKFFASWNFLAQEILGDARGPLVVDWLNVLLGAQLEAASEPQKAALQVLVREPKKLDNDGADQLLLGAMDEAHQSSPIWAELRAFVEAGNSAAEDTARAAVLAEVERRAASLVPGTQLPSKFSQAMVFVSERFLEDYAIHGRRNGVRNHDEGLWLEFESKAPDTTAVDTQIRGFSLALCGGVRSEPKKFWWNKSRAQWITQTAIRHYWKEKDTSNPLQWIDKDDLLKAEVSGNIAVAWYAGTVGSSLVGGRRVGQALYNGAPVFSIAEVNGAPKFVNDQEDIETLDFRWPTVGASALPTPLLGFGMEFSGYATALDNAGGIGDKDLRGEDLLFAELRPAKELKLWEQMPSEGQAIRYESRVPPGAPRLIDVEVRNLDKAPTPVDPTELTDETRAVRYISSKLNSLERPDLEKPQDLVLGASLPRVTCLVHGKGGTELTDLFLPQAPASVTLRIRPPITYVSFVEAWLATDRLILESDFSDADKQALVSDPLFFSHAPQFDAFSEARKKPQTEQCDYHPAVTAIGIELSFPATGATVPLPPIPIARTFWYEEKKEIALSKEEIRLRIEVGAQLELPKPENQWTLKLPPATFVRVRAYSMVKKDYFAIASPLNAHMRYAESVGKDAPALWADYRAFGPLEYWAESMPAWLDTEHAPANRDLDVDIDPPDLSDATTTRLVAKPKQNRPADWIRAVEVFRHSWHWTGYPVQFPPLVDREKLAAWLPAFAGVESKRQREVIELPSYVEGKEWRYGNHAPPAVMPPAPLEITLSSHTVSGGERPSRYAAYTVRPIVRFASWLARGRDPNKIWPRDLARDLFAAGNLIPGMGEFAEGKRMPAPSFRFHIPLTATYIYDPEQKGAAIKLSRENNGNLLIFEDSIRRTDDFSRIGGIGDTIEVDLLQTRSISLTDKLEPRREFFEIGPNPIFHPSPAAGLSPEQLKTMPQLAIEVSEPHGLTFDLVRNAKVAQTAVTVRPALRKGNEKDLEDALRQWILGKVRVRRLILPETQLDSRREFELPWRVDGLDRIPADFTVDGSARAGNRSLKLKIGEEEYLLDVPQDVHAGNPVRWLVSFHKGRWDPQKPSSQPGPYWAPQILVQAPRTQFGRQVLGWETVARSTCYGKEPWEWRDGSLKWEVAGLDAVVVSVAQLSDYTDARWLLFMGRIPGTDKTREDQYALVPEVDGNGNVSALVVTGGSFGSLRRPPQQAEDWKQPSRANPNEVIDTEFYVLFVSSSTSDVISGNNGTEDFGLLTFQSTSPNRFEPLGPMPDFRPEMLRNAAALLCSFQRITSTSALEREVKIDSFNSLMKAIFPDPLNDAETAERYPESLVRPTGSSWGPMPIILPD